jgi:excisionase family DNA binding protein
MQHPIPESRGVTPHPSVLPFEPLLSPRDAARAIGVCERTLFGLTKDRKLPAVRIGRAVRYDPADLREFIDAAKGARK